MTAELIGILTVGAAGNGGLLPGRPTERAFRSPARFARLPDCAAADPSGLDLSRDSEGEGIRLVRRPPGALGRRTSPLSARAGPR